MATIKSFTDISQSKKLTEILPLESADMYWWSSGKRYYIEAMDDGDFNKEEGHVRAWSLAALLDNLKYTTLFQNGDGEWVCTVWIDNARPYSISPKDNPVDACVEMIEKLHKLNLL